MTSKRIGIFSTSQRQQPFVVWEQDRANWRIWIAYNNSVTSGTYLELSATGSVDQVTVLDGDITNVVSISS